MEKFLNEEGAPLFNYRSVNHLGDKVRVASTSLLLMMRVFYGGDDLKTSAVFGVWRGKIHIFIYF